VGIYNMITYKTKGGLTEIEAITSLQTQLDDYPKKGRSSQPNLEGFNKKLKDELEDVESASTEDV
jgi:hypothetical protein